MSDNYGALFPQHAAMLAASGITPEHAFARGYQSVDTRTRLEAIGVTKAGRNVPGLLIPSLLVDGSTWGHQYRPDTPRLNAKGKPIKYETPWQQRNGIDVPPGVGPKLGDPTIPLFITEGVKKADAAAMLGLACVDLPGVWSWRGSNTLGGNTVVPDFHDIALNDRRIILAFDSDVVVKHAVRMALKAFAAYLASKGAHVSYLHLPHTDDGKTGLDDYLADGHNTDDLWRLVSPDMPEPIVPDAPLPVAPPAPARAPRPPVEAITLEQADDVFSAWLGQEYDLDALHFSLALVAVERLDGDAPWGLVLSGSGNAKTETVSAAEGAGAHVTSSISSEGALLSATSRSERAADATGGLLRKIGNTGILVIKDVTTILSMNNDTRLSVLGALREVADGFYERNVGTDGGRSLTWRGRIVVIGAVTTAWDTHHGVIAAMGERFLVLRVDSSKLKGRLASGRQSLANIGSEDQMRLDLRAAFGGVIAGMNTAGAHLTETESETLLTLANIVSAARTGVERDRRGDVVDAHAFEAPTRLVKYLGQVVRGGIAIGLDRVDALRLAVRIAHDCVPPLRLAALKAVEANPGNTTSEIARLMQKPRTSVDRALQELHLLELLEVTSDAIDTKWRYRIAAEVDADALTVLLDGNRGFTRKVSTRSLDLKERETVTPPPVVIAPCTTTDFSGDGFPDLGPVPHLLPLPQDDPWPTEAAS